MSKIALSGDSSGTGTFTIASPNSNSNFTLTLPAASGTVVVSGGAQTVEFAAGSASTPSLTFTGDTNTGIYSPGADRIGFAEGGTQVGEFDASSNFLFNSGFGSVAIGYGCRSWVNFNGTGTIAIRGSGNVSSITDNNTGDYTINFTNAMSDANYSAVCTGENTIGATRNGPAVVNYHTFAAGSLRILTNDPAGSALDFQLVCTSILR